MPTSARTPLRLFSPLAAKESDEIRQICCAVREHDPLTGSPTSPHLIADQDPEPEDIISNASSKRLAGGVVFTCWCPNPSRQQRKLNCCMLQGFGLFCFSGFVVFGFRDLRYSVVHSFWTHCQIHPKGMLHLQRHTSWIHAAPGH